jgi:hypothetical protein
MWYIVYGTHALCVPRHEADQHQLLALNSREECQAYIDEHCQGGDFQGQEFEFIQADNPQAVLDYVRGKQ